MMYKGFANQKRKGMKAPPNGKSAPQKNMNELSAHLWITWFVDIKRREKQR